MQQRVTSANIKIQMKGNNCLLFHSNQHGTPPHMNLLKGGTDSLNYFLVDYKDASLKQMAPNSAKKWKHKIEPH
jgi:hypothetical protein